MAARLDRLKSRLPGRGSDRAGSQAAVDPALIARRDRLVERFTAHQLDLGGVMYEMAVRDHIVMPVLLDRSAVLQAIEADLKQAQAEVDDAQARIDAEASASDRAQSGRPDPAETGGAQRAQPHRDAGGDPVAPAAPAAPVAVAGASTPAKRCGSCGVAAAADSAFCSKCGSAL